MAKLRADDRLSNLIEEGSRQQSYADPEIDLAEWAFAAVMFSCAFAVVVGTLVFAYSTLIHLGAGG